MPITPILGLQEPIVGDSQDIWGGQINNNFIILDSLAASPPIAVNADGTSAPGVALETVEWCDAGAPGITRTLPDATAYDGRIFTYKKIAGTGTVTVTSAQLIDGAATWDLPNLNQYVRVIAGAGTWGVIGNN